MLISGIKISIEKFWLILLGLTLFFMMWVNQTIRSTQLSYNIQKLEEALKTEERKFTQLEMERDRYLSLENIDKNARGQFGFSSSKEEDVIQIEVNSKIK